MKVTSQGTRKGMNVISTERDIHYYIELDLFPRLPDWEEFGNQTTTVTKEDRPELYEGNAEKSFGVFDGAGNQILTLSEYREALRTGCGILDIDGEYNTIIVEEKDVV